MKRLFVLFLLFPTLALGITCPKVISRILIFPPEVIDLRGHLLADPNVAPFQHGVIGQKITPNGRWMFVYDDHTVVILKGYQGAYKFHRMVQNLSRLLQADAVGSWLFKINPAPNGKSFSVRYLVKNLEHPSGIFLSAFVELTSNSIRVTKVGQDISNDER